MRRKADVDCYVGKKFDDPVEHEEKCDCVDSDYEWLGLAVHYVEQLITILYSDYNYVRNGDKCDPAGPEPIGAGVCKDPNGSYMGSSGYRRIPGNTCIPKAGAAKDSPIEKSCSKAKPQEGNAIHQTVSTIGVFGEHLTDEPAVRIPSCDNSTSIF